MYILEIIPLQKGIPRDTLSYFSARPIDLGSVVEIPLNSRIITGIVVAQHSARDAKASIRSGTFSLKSIGHVIRDQQFSSIMMSTLQSISLQTLIPIGTLISTLFPEQVFDFIMNWKPNNDTRSIIRTISLPYNERITYYQSLINESFAKQKSIVIVAPTVTESEELVKFLKQSLPSDQVLCLHGSLTAKRKESVYALLSETSHPLIICATPQYVCIPRNDIYAYILESINSPYYRNSFSNFIDFRTVLIPLIQTFGHTCYLGDTIISPDELFLLDKRKAFPDRSSFKYINNTIIDIIEKESSSSITYQSPLFSSKTLEHIHDHLKLNKRIFVYTARKSIATITSCRDCGYIVTCPNCTSIMNLIKKNPLSSSDRVFHCNVCETEIPPMNRCPQCLGWNIVPLGITTESTAEELSRIFPGVQLYQSNNDLTKTESACKKMITSWESNGGILIGTQKIIPFIHTTDLSIIASFEHCMSIPDYSTTMTTLWTFQKILEKTTNHYLVQTKYPDQSFLHNFKTQQWASLIDEDNELRKQYYFPPYSTIITITMEHISRKDHAQAKDFLKQSVKPFEHTVQSQFFEYSQTYTIYTTIHINTNDWRETSNLDIKRLRQLLETIRTHSTIKIETPWILE